MNSRIVIIDSVFSSPSPAYHPSFPANLNQPENHSRQCQNNDRIESWRMETRARTMDTRYWMTSPPSVLLPNVPSHAVGGNANRNVSTKQRYEAVRSMSALSVTCLICLFSNRVTTTALFSNRCLTLTDLSPLVVSVSLGAPPSQSHLVSLCLCVSLLI